MGLWRHFARGSNFWNLALFGSGYAGLRDRKMIESGDLVREVGTNQILTAKVKNSRGQWQVQFGNNPIPIRFVDESSLELVEKAPGKDLGGPGVTPERWVL